MADTQRTEGALKAIFITGAKPTQQDFHDWLYTMFLQDSANATAAATALANSVSALAKVPYIPKVFANLYYNGATWAANKVTGCTFSVVGTKVAKLTFTTPFSDIHYCVNLSFLFSFYMVTASGIVQADPTALVLGTYSPVGVGPTGPVVLATTDVQIPLNYLNNAAGNKTPVTGSQVCVSCI